jgi:hypothetical protein
MPPSQCWYEYGCLLGVCEGREAWRCYAEKIDVEAVGSYTPAPRWVGRPARFLCSVCCLPARGSDGLAEQERDKFCRALVTWHCFFCHSAQNWFTKKLLSSRIERVLTVVRLLTPLHLKTETDAGSETLGPGSIFGIPVFHSFCFLMCYLLPYVWVLTFLHSVHPALMLRILYSALLMYYCLRIFRCLYNTTTGHKPNCSC